MTVTTRNRELLVLGIETSCDETAAGVVRRDAHGRGTILSNVVRDQVAAHAEFGGVVPEIAARAHAEITDTVVAAALTEAGVSLADLDGIAATAGPGLIGGVMVGLVTAKMLALAAGKPLVAVNHLEGHALTVGLSEGVRPPYLLLLVSGGHTQLLAVEDIGRYRRIGGTIDDALGEAFDKTAKMLGLGYPGGPAVERLAVSGTADRFALPRPLKGRPGADFSFAGLKTAVRQIAETLQPIDEATARDLCAAFQAAAIETVMDRVANGMEIYTRSRGEGRHLQLVVAGGVAANRAMASALAALAARFGFSIAVPPARLCTDNGVMIAWAGAERLARGWVDGLEVPARARWPLDEAQFVSGVAT
ncbi:MAG: tRNA (adenosine(37)-N6)-threonylcarbamoyltransferase complex transferase subunit TsaD [Rhizobiales bacterium]|nr:tRNA (adenosine(37)-N6)-threonylcarbamoyltransferase complex transferase subunit TsaD [Hyphomicrobiales bacterium]